MYRVFAIQGGYAVAFVRPDARATVVMETHSREAADENAARRNVELQAEKARQRLREIANMSTWGERRPVRWFEPDAFA